MEEFSNAVLEERDLVNEQLRLKESEIDQERMLRKELNERLTELQNKVRNILLIFLSYCIVLYCTVHTCVTLTSLNFFFIFISYFIYICYSIFLLFHSYFFISHFISFQFVGHNNIQVQQAESKSSGAANFVS